MKKIFKYAFLPLLSGLILLSSCKKDGGYEENPSGETIIYTLELTNGDIAGNKSYQGILNEATQTYEFTIPAETAIEAVKFGGRISLGANFDQQSYDFSQSLTQQIAITNGENKKAYNATINLLPAEATPLLQSLRIRTQSGMEVDAIVNHVVKTIYLGRPSDTKADIVTVKMLPSRTQYQFTAISGSTITNAAPGKIKLDFMGIKNEYSIDFDNEPTFGADFTKAKTYDYSLNAAPNGVPDEWVSTLATMMTRCSDFDGNTVLIPTRKGGTFVKVYDYADLRNNDASKDVNLNVTGVTGGTYTVNAGRIAQGHFYVCNLTTGIANTAAGKLAIYHWADKNSAPQKIVDFGDNTIVTGRYGDNMSVNLDENGNGYIWLVEHATGAQVLRIQIENFTTVKEYKKIIPPFNASYYACYQQVPGQDNEFLYIGNTTTLALVDKDGNAIYTMPAGKMPLNVTDAKIISYRSERYLLCVNGRKSGANQDSQIYVYNISDGANTTLALQNFANLEARVPIYNWSLGASTLASNPTAYSANCGWGVFQDGSADGALVVYGSFIESGFALGEFPEKE